MYKNKCKNELWRTITFFFGTKKSEIEGPEKFDFGITIFRTSFEEPEVSFEEPEEI
jgi:hypothetical protein